MGDKHPLFTTGVRDDGTVDGFQIETRLLVPYFVWSQQLGYVAGCHAPDAPDKRWVEFTCDDGGCDTLIRIPVEAIEMMHNVIRLEDG